MAKTCFNCKEKEYPTCYSTCEHKKKEEEKQRLIREGRKSYSSYGGYVVNTIERFTGLKRGEF